MISATGVKLEERIVYEQNYEEECSFGVSGLIIAEVIWQSKCVDMEVEAFSCFCKNLKAQCFGPN